MYNIGSYFVYGIADEVWTLTVQITSPGQAYSLNLLGSQIDLRIDWGNGTINNYTTSGVKSNTYSSAGTYLVKIRGSMTSGQIRQSSAASYANAARVIATTPIRGITFNGVMNCTEAFRGCTNLTTIPNDLFKYIPNCIGFLDVFRNCTSLNSIPSDLFRYNINAQTFAAAFSSCSSLTSIPTDLFRYNTLVSGSGFASVFFNCNITSIPVDLFRYNLDVSTNAFLQSFSGNNNITSIPVDLFRYNVNVADSGFLNTFSSTSITSIPIDLFRYNVNVSGPGFQGTFSSTSITSIPVDLFRYNVNVSTNAFDSTFFGCSSLTSISTDLFRYNVNVSTDGFRQSFAICTSITSVPIDLFRYNVQCTGFGSTFSNCFNLRLNTQIFGPSLSTRFLNQSVDFKDLFRLDFPFTGTQGTAPELWNAAYGTGTPTTTDCFQGHSGASLTNHASIPPAWL